MFRKEQPREKQVRFLAFEEDRLLSITQTQEQVRSYGSHFSNKDLGKIQMPRIWWNGQVRSVRSLNCLTKIELVGYKRLLLEEESSQQSPI